MYRRAILYIRGVGHRNCQDMRELHKVAERIIDRSQQRLEILCLHLALYWVGKMPPLHPGQPLQRCGHHRASGIHGAWSERSHKISSKMWWWPPKWERRRPNHGCPQTSRMKNGVHPSFTAQADPKVCLSHAENLCSICRLFINWDPD